MASLYPDIRPYVTHSLQVDPIHTLHGEECGNRKGIPALFLHGGPGAGCEAYHRRFFDPSRYRVILFDQRGAGRSTPHAELTNNNTQELVADLERIRQHLGIDRWLLFGGSWGSALALLYAEAYPERVLGMILRGIFLCRPQDISWFYQAGASQVLPDYWQDFLRPIPVGEQARMVEAYYARLTGADDISRMAAAKAWSLWEAQAATLQRHRASLIHFSDPFTALAMARIECHYFVHDAFLEPDQILRDAGTLAGIPGVMIHGRYDMVCPLDNAWALRRVWPDAELKIIPGAGHAATEPGIAAALVEATDGMADRLSA